MNVTSVPVTVCDVAVISCLLNERWCEDGVLWGINYLVNKLQLETDTENEKRYKKGFLIHSWDDLLGIKKNKFAKDSHPE